MRYITVCSKQHRNQDVLTAERDKYNANDIKPGLTGWAQINGFSIKEGRIYLDRKDYNKDFNVTNCFWTDKRTRGY